MSIENNIKFLSGEAMGESPELSPLEQVHENIADAVCESVATSANFRAQPVELRLAVADEVIEKMHTVHNAVNGRLNAAKEIQGDGARNKIVRDGELKSIVKSTTDIDPSYYGVRTGILQQGVNRVFSKSFNLLQSGMKSAKEYLDYRERIKGKGVQRAGRTINTHGNFGTDDYNR